MLLCSSWLSAEDAASSLGITASYRSENYLHPGAELGIEWVSNEEELNSFTMGGETGFAVFNPFYTSIFLKYNIGYRLNLPSGLDFSAGGGLGYKHLFLLAGIYKDTGGSVSEAANTGQPLFVADIRGGIGYNLIRLTGIPVRIFINYGISLEGPYNRVLLFHPVIDAGVRISLEGVKE